MVHTGMEVEGGVLKIPVKPTQRERFAFRSTARVLLDKEERQADVFFL